MLLPAISIPFVASEIGSDAMVIGGAPFEMVLDPTTTNPEPVGRTELCTDPIVMTPATLGPVIPVGVEPNVMVLLPATSTPFVASDTSSDAIVIAGASGAMVMDPSTIEKPAS